MRCGEIDVQAHTSSVWLNQHAKRDFGNLSSFLSFCSCGTLPSERLQRLTLLQTITGFHLGVRSCSDLHLREYHSGS